MATLDLENVDIDSEYSDEFELEDITESLNSTEDESRKSIVAQLQKSLEEGKETAPLQPLKTKRGDTTTQNKHFTKTIRTPMKLDIPTKPDGSTTSMSRTMHMASNSSKKFNSSVDVREACYADWLSRKRSSISLDKSAEVMSKDKEEIQKKLKQKEKAEREGKALERWNASKVEEVKKKQIFKRELLAKEHLEEEERKLKMESAKFASEKWREERTQRLIVKQREKRKKEIEETKKKEEEAREKGEASTLAFNAWKSRKDESTVQERKKKQVKEKNKHWEVKNQKKVKAEESRKAFEAWKSQKDEVIKTNRTLCTYQNQSKIHTQAWRPARGMSYDYPKHPSGVSKKAAKKPSQTSSRRESIDSYQSASFDSYDSDTDTRSSVEEESSESLGKVNSIMTTGKRKTIQVCCQTLEYWCTCDDHAD